MPDFVTLSCPSCGGRLQITKDIERFACSYCGQEHIVKRGRGVVTLTPVVEGLSKIQRGTDRTATELAIKRLRDEIADGEQEVSRLAPQALAEDFAHVEDGLRRECKRSFKGVKKGSNKDATYILHCQKLIQGLSASEMQRVIRHIPRRILGKSKSLATMDAILVLKVEIEGQRAQIEKHKRDLAD